MVSGLELDQAVSELFGGRWVIRTSTTVPLVESIALKGTDGVKLDGCVLYADMSDSTGLVDNYSPTFAAGIYKAYMHCAGRIIRDAGGSITAYDGDRIMAVFLGHGKENAAVTAALRLNFMVWEIIHPALEKHFPTINYRPNHTVSVDASDLLVARTGVRSGNDVGNDLVWVGSAANHAAKLCADKLNGAIRMTGKVWGALMPGLRSYQGTPMWQVEGLTQSGAVALSSNWWFNLWYGGEQP